MEISPDKKLEMLAYEAFIRRAAEINLPFMLKGSYVTRQYFPNPNDRLPNDLDWVYLNLIENVEQADKVFDDWAIQVTELTKEDGVIFKSFKENAFWRRIDYAMADDFPTVNTDLCCWVDEVEFDWFSLDVSFNLPIEFPPVPLVYTPLQGEAFTIPYTVPLSLQVAWKLHQTLVRPRFKDIYDLIHLLKHPAFNSDTLKKSLKALGNECYTSHVDIFLLDWFLSEKASRYNSLRENKKQYTPEFVLLSSELDFKSHLNKIDISYSAYFTLHPKSSHPTLSYYLEQFSLALNKAGFTIELLAEFSQHPTHPPKNITSSNPKFEPPLRPDLPQIQKPVGKLNTAQNPVGKTTIIQNPNSFTKILRKLPFIKKFFPD